MLVAVLSLLLYRLQCKWSLPHLSSVQQHFCVQMGQRQAARFASACPLKRVGLPRCRELQVSQKVCSQAVQAKKAVRFGACSQ